MNETPNDITVFIHYNTVDESIPTRDDIIIQDLINQLVERSVCGLKAGTDYVINKKGSEKALSKEDTLAEAGVLDQDHLYLTANDMKAGC